MNFDFTYEQRERFDAIVKFAQGQLSPGARERDAGAHFDRSKWDEAAEFGLAGLPIPEKWGGLGLDALDTVLAVEALGKGCEDSGLVFSLCAHMFACAVPVWLCKKGDLRDRFLEGMATGRLIACNAATEPEAGSDIYAMKTTAKKNGNGYVINGDKCFITNAPVADVFLVYAMTDPSKGMFGITAFLLPRDTPGMTVVPDDPKQGLKTSPWGRIYFNNCEVPEESRLGSEGSGASLFRSSMFWERGCLFAFYVGAMDRILTRCVNYARERVQFGNPIGHYQSVSNRLVDMKLRLETSRLLLYNAGWRHANGKRSEQATALSKLWISESAVAMGLDAVQIFGGTGITTSSGIDVLLRDALPAGIFSGTSEMQRTIIARTMGIK